MTAVAEPKRRAEQPSTFEVRSPADGRVVACLPVHDANQVAAMASHLRSAQPAWEELGADGRAKHLLAWLDWIMDNERRLVQLVQAESGKSWGDALLEPTTAVDVIRYATRNAGDWLAPQKVRPHNPLYAGKRLRAHVRPHQLVGVILPWNMPLGMPMLDIPFALAAGAAVLSKPSEITPLAWSEAVRGWNDEIGAPPVLGVVTGFGETGAAVVDHVDMVQFTGSTRTGRAVGIRAAERLIPCSLELGGKDAMIVLEDADVDRAVDGAVWGGMFNAGQACISIERVYVHEQVHDEFVAKLTQKVAVLRQGTDTDGSFTAEVGALATRQQVAIVESHVQDAVAKGAVVTTGGSRKPHGNYFEPTVLTNVDHTMVCMQEETFGPTLPVMKVRDEAEAIRLANDSNYGLGGSVWTADASRAERVAVQLETGGVCVNNALVNAFQLPLPFGGWKSSGIGYRGGGRQAMLKYCRQQAFVAERVHLAKEANWYPYSPRRAKVISAAIRLVGMRGRRRFGIAPRSR